MRVQEIYNTKKSEHYKYWKSISSVTASLMEITLTKL